MFAHENLNRRGIVLAAFAAIVEEQTKHRQLDFECDTMSVELVGEWKFKVTMHGRVSAEAEVELAPAGDFVTSLVKLTAYQVFQKPPQFVSIWKVGQHPVYLNQLPSYN